MKKTKIPPLRRAFSLVEVVLALGLVSFCLVAIIGMLPVGLQSVKNAKEESAAANALNQIAAGIRNATITNGSYQASGGFEDITWSADGTSHEFSQPLSLEGQPEANTNEVRLKGHVELIAPGSDNQPSVAQISVAWPSSATWATNGWTKSRGSISSGIIFLPRQ